MPINSSPPAPGVKPEYVTQRTVESVVGMPPRQYLAAARAGHFASSKIARLVYARTADVEAYVLSHLRARPADVQDEDTALRLVGARRVGSAA